MWKVLDVAPFVILIAAAVLAVLPSRNLKPSLKLIISLQRFTLVREIVVVRLGIFLARNTEASLTQQPRLIAPSSVCALIGVNFYDVLFPFLAAF